MRISARCDYACKAVLELALHWPDENPVQMQTISMNHGIPLKYLPQVLIQLKRMKVVESTRGKRGGYMLARSPGEISLGEIVREMGGPLLPVSKCCAGKESAFRAIWGEVEFAMAKVLDMITFEDIAKKVKGIKNAIIYQI